MSEIDEYLSKVDAPQRAELERIRKIVKQTAPDAEEVITYGMPGFKYKKKYLIAYAPFKDHMSIFPGSATSPSLKAKLSGFKQSKGTIQFTLENSIPKSILLEIVKNRAQAIDKSLK